MSIRRVLAALVAVLLTAGTFSALNPASATSSSQSARSEKTVYFNMYYSPHVTPKRIYMTANSGPWMRRLNWDGWGTGTAVGNGTWISDCASCPGPDRRQVKITFHRRVYCPAQDVHTYRRAHVVLSEPDEGYTDRTFSFRTGGCPPRY